MFPPYAVPEKAGDGVWGIGAKSSVKLHCTRHVDLQAVGVEFAAAGEGVLVLPQQCYLLVVRTESRCWSSWHGAARGFATSGADTDQSMDGASVSNSTTTNHEAECILACMIGREHEWDGGRMGCER